MAGPGPCFGGTGGTEESGVLSKTMHSIICRGSLFTDELWTLKTCQASLAFAYLWAPRMALGGEEPLEEGMATHTRILAWRILWTEKPGGLQSIGYRELNRTQPSTAQLYSHPPCGPQSSSSFPKQLLGVHPSMYLPMCSPPRVVFFYKSPVTTVP